MKSVDLFVVGGGINGVGIARDAAGRGLSVCLCERDDLASHTSSWSTKLIHGGLRYLEQREFRLVRESLIEREVLLDAAPHLITPLRLILPHHSGMRPAWLLRLGLFLYDHLGGRKYLPGTERVDLTGGKFAGNLKSEMRFGYEFTDCQVDDSRLVVENALDAAARGADIRTRTELISARRQGSVWHCEVRTSRGNTEVIEAKALINTAGPWVAALFERIEGIQPRKSLRLVKGSHLIVPQLFEHDRAFFFQNADGRVIFTIPYLGNKTLIGTTDQAYEGDPAKVRIDEDETAYLCASVNEYLNTQLTVDQVIGTYAGVRPLYDDLGKENVSAVTRDYAFDVDAEGGAPLLSVYGGKLTTYRKLAEHALVELAKLLPGGRPAWTAKARLPGGVCGYEAWGKTKKTLRQQFDFLPSDVFNRMTGAFGGRLPEVLGDATALSDLGRHFGAGLYAREVDYLVAHEWAVSADDILTRRTKLHLEMSAQEKAALADYLGEAA